MLFKSLALCASALLISPVYSGKCSEKGTNLELADGVYLYNSFIGGYDVDKQVQSFCKGPTGTGTGDGLPLLAALTDYFSKQPEVIITELKARVDINLPAGTVSWKTVGKGLGFYKDRGEIYTKNTEGTYFANMFNVDGKDKEKDKAKLLERIDKLKAAMMKIVATHMGNLQKGVDSLKQVCNAKPKEGFMGAIAGAFSDTCGPFCDNGVVLAGTALDWLSHLLPDLKNESKFEVSKYDANGTPTKETLTLEKAVDMIRSTSIHCAKKSVPCQTSCGTFSTCRPDRPGFHIVGGPEKICN